MTLKKLCQTLLTLSPLLFCQGMDHYRHLLSEWPADNLPSQAEPSYPRKINRNTRWQRYGEWRELYSRAEVLKSRCTKANDSWAAETFELLQAQVQRFEAQCLNADTNSGFCARDGQRLSEVRLALAKIQNLCESQFDAQEWRHTQKENKNLRLEALVGHDSLPAQNLAGLALKSTLGFAHKSLFSQSYADAAYTKEHSNLFNYRAGSSLLWSTQSVESQIKLSAKRDDNFIKLDQTRRASIKSESGDWQIRLAKFFARPELAFSYTQRESHPAAYTGKLLGTDLFLNAQENSYAQSGLYLRYLTLKASESSIIPGWRSTLAAVRVRGRSALGGRVQMLAGAEERKDHQQFVRVFPYFSLSFEPTSIPAPMWQTDALVWAQGIRFSSQTEIFYRADESLWSSMAQQFGLQNKLHWQLNQWLLDANLKFLMQKHLSSPGGRRSEWNAYGEVQPTYRWLAGFDTFVNLAWERSVVLSGSSQPNLWTPDQSFSRFQIKMGIAREFF